MYPQSTSKKHLGNQCRFRLCCFGCSRLHWNFCKCRAVCVLNPESPRSWGMWHPVCASHGGVWCLAGVMTVTRKPAEVGGTSPVPLCGVKGTSSPSRWERGPQHWAARTLVTAPDRCSVTLFLQHRAPCLEPPGPPHLILRLSLLEKCFLCVPATCP